jgi:hypothetical protein
MAGEGSRLRPEDDGDDLAFMLRRALPLCLTDPKAARAGGKRVLFDIKSAEDSQSADILFRPLLLMANALRCGEELETRLSAGPPSDTPSAPIVGDSRARFRRIDWDRTADHFGRGVRQVAFVEHSTELTHEESKLLALVATEYLTHCFHLIDAFTERRVCPHTKTLDDMANLLRVRRAAVQRATDAFRGIGDEQAWAEDQLRRCLGAFGAALRGSLRGQSHDGSPDLWDVYLLESARSFEGQWPGVRNARWALAWRRNYIDLASGFGFGARLEARQLRDPAHLYELWCFTELGDILVKAGKRKLLQRYVLARKDPESIFEGDSNMRVFYNWFGKQVALPMRSRVLPRARVEWYISTGIDEQNGIVIDTKYKELSSRDVLTVMGYMMNFGVKRGVVFCRGKVDSRMVDGESLTEGLVVGNLAGMNQGILCAVSLIPDVGAMQGNLKRLSELAKTLGLTDGSELLRPGTQSQI